MAVAIGWLPIVPPEHVHEDHADHHLIVHRHANAHALSPRPAAAHHSVDDDDGPVLTLDATYMVPTVLTVAAGPAVLTVAVIDAPAAGTLYRTRDFVQRLIHGPPRAPVSLRGPPLFA